MAAGAVVQRGRHGRALIVEGNLAHTAAFFKPGAVLARIGEKDLVEVGAPYLPCVGHRLVPGLAELDRTHGIAVGRDKFGAPLLETDPLDLFTHAQLVEEPTIGGQK